jgi:CHASE2 domain-containing sensor protein
MFSVIGIFTFIPFNCLFLDPIKTSISDFDVYDIVFSKIREEQTADTNIVLVNLGNLSRYDLARQVNLISSFNPRVVALDVLFEEEKDPFADAILADAFSKCQNLVLVSRLENYNDKKKIFDTLLTSINLFNQYASNGFANLPSDEKVSFRTIREFQASAKVDNQTVQSFAAKIVEKYNHEAFKFLEKREESIEKINYVGNYNKFYFLDTEQVLTGTVDLSFVKDKIVLLGFIGINSNNKTLEDIFFTPLNDRYAGKSFPDMYGVVIQANIVSMILNKNYINTMPQWLSILIAIVLTYVSAYIIYNIKIKIKDWFGVIAKLYILTLSLSNLFIGVMAFHHFNYRINLTLGLAVVVLAGTITSMYEMYVVNIFSSLEK